MPENVTHLRRAKLGEQVVGGRLWTSTTGVVSGLALARLASEALSRPWRLSHAVLFVVMGIALGVAITFVIEGASRRLGRSWTLWPLMGLSLYVVWPAPAFGLGAGLVLGLAVATIVLNGELTKGRWLGPAVLVGALTLYVCTCSRAVLGADAGEFQLVANALGIAHPPGYALYTMVGHLFARLPLGNPAFRINCFSAVTSALTLCVGAMLVRRETGSAIAGSLFAAALGLSATFWVQGTIANIRSLSVFLLLLAVDALLRWRADPSLWRLAWVGMVVGLGAGHHSSLLLLAPVFAGFVIACDPTILRAPRRWIPPLGAFVGSLSVWLYLPIRSAMGSPFDPEPIVSLAGFWQHVLALGFRGDMLHFSTLSELIARLGVFGQILRLELGWILVCGCLAGAIALVRRNWRVALLLGGIWLLNVALALTYRAPQTVEYLLPSYASMLLVLAMGLGGWKPTGWRGGVRALMLGGLLAVSLANGMANWPSLRALGQDDTDQRYAAELLETAPVNGLILSNWHHATTMWYLQIVEDRRPDVEVVYVYPEGDTPNHEVWLRRISEEIQVRPVMVTNWFYAYENTGYRFLPLADGWRVFDDEHGQVPADAEPMAVTFDEGMRLLGVATDAREAVPGKEIEVRVYWEALQSLERDYTGFVQLLGTEGVLGQSDAFHRADRIGPEILQVDVHQLTLLWHAKPGTYRLIAGFYYLDDAGTWQRCTANGADHVSLGEIQVLPQNEAPASLHAMEIPFEGGVSLVGYDYDRGIVGQTRVYLHFAGTGGMERSDEIVTAFLRASLSADGELLGSADVPLVARNEAATVAVDLPGAPEVVDLTLETMGGDRLPWAGPWHLRQRRGVRLHLANPAQRYVPLGGGVAYTGMGGCGELRAEDRWEAMVLTSRWLALRPLTRDYAVSVGMQTRESEIKADGTPAMGAIPTLKWLSGWRVKDVREISWETDTASSVQSCSAEMYDAFTLAPLQVLDERLVREGQGIRILEQPLEH